MREPWLPVEAVPPEAIAGIRRRAIFDYCKWDPQVEDDSAIAPHALVLRDETWRELAALAERLAAEALDAERELVGRPELHDRLGLPRAVRAALARARRDGVSRDFARLIRFDFHHTTDGWRISEANTDVPGGLNEASGFASLFAPHYPDADAVGDPVAAYAEAILDGSGVGSTVALVHATAYTDDRQVMVYLSRALEQRGVRTVLASPSHLRWTAGRARLASEFASGEVHAVVRFFPGEWLPNLEAHTGWPHFFAGARTPVSNPASALLTQSKRFPLVWDVLRTAMPTWRALLPETRDPRDCRWASSDEWVLKPALGRVGEDVGMRGVTAPKEWRALARWARWTPWHWVAQRRFEALPLECGDARAFPCVGVFTIGTRAVGAYGRLARRPIIDWKSQDIAIMRTRANGASIGCPI